MLQGYWTAVNHNDVQNTLRTVSGTQHGKKCICIGPGGIVSFKVQCRLEAVGGLSP